MIAPFTVSASARPAAEIVTPPFTVYASASAGSAFAWMLPFTVRPTKRMPAGTRTVKSTFTSLSFAFMRPLSPGRHSLGRPAGLG